jgi:Flp pilus assembly pilin Flp
VKRFVHDKSGSTAEEYTIIAVVIVIAIVAAITEIGIRVNAMLQSVPIF